MNENETLQITESQNLQKHPGGRPTLYKPEFCQELINFFDVEPYTEKEIKHFKKNDISWSELKRIPNKLPTIRNFAKKINVQFKTVYNWLNTDSPTFQPEFLHAFNLAKLLRKDFLIENGLQGLHNPNYAIFVAKNLTDMRDVKEIDQRTQAELTVKIESKSEILVKLLAEFMVTTGLSRDESVKILEADCPEITTIEVPEAALIEAQEAQKQAQDD